MEKETFLADIASFRTFVEALACRLGLRTMPASPCPADHCDRELHEKGDHAMHRRDDYGIRGSVCNLDT